MSENDKPDVKSFWTTLPGILSGLAALVAAIGSVLTIYFTHMRTSSAPPPPPPPAMEKLAPAATPAPPPAAPEPTQAYQPQPPASQPAAPASRGRWPWTSERYLKDQDVAGLSRLELALMRNEIFARHGWVFGRDDLRAYFNNQPWYRPKGDLANQYRANRLATSELSAIERYNVNFIKQYENR